MSLIKQCFTSRWEGGYLVQTDYSQLEVICVAFLSQDENLYEDLKEGRDMHCISASFLYDTPYEEMFQKAKIEGDPKYVKMRKEAKAPSFQLQYGAGYKSIAASCGLDERHAKQFIENYYGRYQQLYQWQLDNIDTVNRSRCTSDKRSPKGYMLGRGELVGLTGRRWWFYEEDAPDWMKAPTSFKPTKIKNYPSQGFAGGDVVMTAIGELYHRLKADPELRDKALLVNTIHDSVMLDVSPEVLDKAIVCTENTLSGAPELLRERFGIEFDLELPVETEIGHNWGEMDVYNRVHNRGQTLHFPTGEALPVQG